MKTSAMRLWLRSTRPIDFWFGLLDDAPVSRGLLFEDELLSNRTLELSSAAHSPFFIKHNQRLRVTDQFDLEIADLEALDIGILADNRSPG